MSRPFISYYCILYVGSLIIHVPCENAFGDSNPWSLYRFHLISFNLQLAPSSYILTPRARVDIALLRIIQATCWLALFVSKGTIMQDGGFNDAADYDPCLSALRRIVSRSLTSGPTKYILKCLSHGFQLTAGKPVRYSTARRATMASMGFTVLACVCGLREQFICGFPHYAGLLPSLL